MIFDKRSLLLFASNVLLLHLMLLINSSITIAGFNLFILGPIFIIAPLYLRADQFFITTVLTGFWVDAALPTSFGLVTLLMHHRLFHSINPSSISCREKFSSFVTRTHCQLDYRGNTFLFQC